jgi:hypothetical protein
MAPLPGSVLKPADAQPQFLDLVFCNQWKRVTHLVRGSREAFSIAVATLLEANHSPLATFFTRE